MRNRIIARILTLVLLLTFFSNDTSAQITQEQTNSLLIGSWSIDLTASIDLMNEKKRAKYDALSATDQNSLKAQLDKQQFTFENDSSFSIAAGDQSYSGAWQIESNQLILTFVSGSSVTHQVEQIEEDNVVLRIVQDPDSEAYFHRISLSPITK